MTSPRARLGAAAALIVLAGAVIAPAAQVTAGEIAPDDHRLTTGIDPRSPEIAFDPVSGNLLVVWEEQVGVDTRVDGMVVSSAGVAGNPFTIGSSAVFGGDASEIGVAADTANGGWLVAYAVDDTVDGALEIAAARVSSGGGVSSLGIISQQGTVATNAAYDGRRPDVAYNAANGEFAVIWAGDDDSVGTNASFELYGRRIGIAGPVGAAATRLTSTALSDDDDPTVVWAGDRYVIVFEAFDGISFEFHSIAVDSTLAPVHAEADVTDSYSFDDVIGPELAINPAAGIPVLVFEGINGGLSSVWAVGINPVSGGALNAPVQVSGAPSAGFESVDPHIAFNPTSGSYDVVWEGSRSGVTAANEFEIFTVPVAVSGTTVGTVARISTMGTDGDTTVPATNPAVAPRANASSYVVWAGANPGGGADATASSGDLEIFGQAIGPDVDLRVASVTNNTSPAGTVDTAAGYTYTVTAGNNSTVFGVTGAVVSMAVPAGMTVDGVAGPTTRTRTVNISANSTAQAQFAVTVTAAKGTVFAPVFSVAPPAGYVDPSSANDSATASNVTVVGPPVATSFTVASDNANPAYAKLGNTITATIVTDEAITTPTVTIGGNATTVSGSGTNWTATYIVTGTTAEGATSATITAATSVASGRAMTTPVVSSSSVIVDRTAPTGTWSTLLADPTNAAPITATIAFDENVTWSGPLSFSVTNGAIQSGSTISPSQYSVNWNPVADGLTEVTGVAGTFADAAGNTNAAVSFSITSDRTAPAPVITSAEPDPTNSPSFDVTIAFAETVNGFVTGDVTVGNGSVTSLTDDGGGTFTATIEPTTNGSVTVDVAGGVATDTAGNTNTAASQFSMEFDASGPTVTVEQAAAQADPTNGTSAVFDVVFSEPVVGLLASDFTVTGVTYSSVGITTADARTYELTVNGVSTDGTVTVSLPAAVATDAAGNGNLASTSTDNAVTFDASAPTSQIVQSSVGDPTNASSVEFAVTFSEDVVGFTNADVDLTNSTTPGVLTANVTGGPSVYAVTVAGYTGDGVVDARVADGAATDGAGNASVAQPSPDFSVEIDQTAPTVTIDQGAGQADPANAGPIVFDVVFSEDVTGFDGTDVAIGGTAGATTATVTPVSATEYTVEVSGMTGDGDVVVTVAADVAVDAAGNGNDASTSTDDTVAFDTTAPTVTIDQGATQIDSANTSPIVFDVVFSEDVTGFTGADVAVSGTAGATTATVTPVSGSAYTVEVSGMTGDGTVIASIAAGAAVDAAGNTSAAATSTDNVVTYIAGDVTPGVNDAPVITAPATVAAELGVARAFAGSASVAITDPDALDGDLVVTLAIDTGALALGSTTGLTVTGTSSAWTLTGALADLNAALATLTATVDDVGTSTISIGVDDQGNTDGAALTDTATVAVTVGDTTAPTIVVPSATVTANSEPGKAGATVTYQVTVNDRGSAPLTERFVESTSADRFVELEPAPELSCSPASGSFFPIGTTTVGCTATDSSGNVGTASFAVVVVDDEAPVISGATNQTFALGTAGSGAVTYVPPSASDNSGTVTLSCTPASGSVMSAGVRTITCTATDPSGNTATASFTVAVTSGRIPDTGGGGLPFLPWAFGLAALGALLVGGTRRRTL